MAMNPVVKCTVDQCTHNVGGKSCAAAKISVYNNEETATSKTFRDTQCKSFHPRKTFGDVVGSLHNVNVGGAVTAAFMEGKQLTPKVECFVDNCKYWQSNNLCDAAAIEIAGKNAACTQDTDCVTFTQK